MKRPVLLLLLAIGMIGAIAYADGPAPAVPQSEAEIIASYEFYPPTAEEVWIQKMAQPLDNGSNVIMYIKYSNDVPLLPVINVHQTSTIVTAFHDDGVAPDLIAQDQVYAGYVKEDIPKLVDRLEGMEAALQAQGSLTVFNGHVAERLATLPVFNKDGFLGGTPVPLGKHIIDGADCADKMLKQNSLLITELSVVEDPARTYNIVSKTGNKEGVWTFGNLVKNIAGPGTNKSRDFLKNWLAQWMEPQTINGDYVPARHDVFSQLIKPWVCRAHNDPFYAVNENNWKTVWDATIEDSIVLNAPFKLSAIVNRLDLLGNLYYSSLSGRTGETRFIFSLIAPYSQNGNFAGKIPRHPNMDHQQPELGFSDWEGMNMIFEYHNMAMTGCEMKDFANDWLDLSSYPSFGADYNDALEQITHTVIDRKASGTPSLLGRIRTNERIFQRIEDHTPSSWGSSNWEMRQFELNANGQLEGVPVFNTPRRNLNFASTLGDANYPYAQQGFFNPDEPALFALEAASLPFMNWIYLPVNRNPINADAHIIPKAYLAGVATSDADYAQFYDFLWTPSPENNVSYANNWYDPNAVLNGSLAVREQARSYRNHISLQTCQGCHEGETKGQFTQIRPLGYGESARYWDPVPDTFHSVLDTRILSPAYQVNTGKTDSSGTLVANNSNTAFLSKQIYMKVSAFLTGRNYSGPVTNTMNGLLPGTFQDDNGNDANDHLMSDFYNVYDPANSADPNGVGKAPAPHDKVNGYNDLKHRQVEMCKLLNLTCTGGVLNILTLVSTKPSFLD